MKKILKIETRNTNATECITLDTQNPEFAQLVFDCFTEQDKTRDFAQINLLNINYNAHLTADLLRLLTNNLQKGATITINNKQIPQPKIKKWLKYSFVDYNLTQPTPQRLANFICKNNKSFFDNLRDFAKRNTISANYIPRNLWQYIDDFNQFYIDKVNKYNANLQKNNLQQYNIVKKHIVKFCLKNKIFIDTLEKDFYECQSELQFEKEQEQQQSFAPLTEQEQAFFDKNARFYGITTSPLYCGVYHRKTPQGYTEEPYFTADATNYNAFYDKKKSHIDRENAKRREVPNPQQQRQAFESLLYIMENLGDAGLDSGYYRCPHCQQICNEKQPHICNGVEKPAICETFANDNIFYGIANDFDEFIDPTKNPLQV